MEQEQCLEEKPISELELMGKAVDLIDAGVKVLHHVVDNVVTPLMKHFPEIERTPEEEEEWQKIKKELNAAIDQSLAENKRVYDAWYAEQEVIRLHSRIMFAEQPEGTLLSIAQVREDYYARQAKAALC